MLQCTLSAELSYERFVRRAKEDALTRASHPDTEVIKALEEGSLSSEDFGPLDLAIPMLIVDTTSGYNPGIESVIEFIKAND